MPANRYCDFGAGNDNISDSFGEITDGFTAAQEDIDANDANIASLQQQITTEQQQRIAADTAHANSTTAHPAEHITYSGEVAGASNVKQAADALKARIDTLVINGDSSAAAADAAAGLDGTPHDTLKDRLDYMEAKQLAAASQKETITHGLNYIASDTASDADVVVKGVTRVNLPGKEGGFHALGNWTGLTIDNTVYKFGTSSGKIDNSAGAGAKLAFNSSKLYLNGKLLLVGFWAKAASGTPRITIGIRARDAAGNAQFDYLLQNNITINNTWTFYWAKLDLTAASYDHYEMRLTVESFGTADDVVSFDGGIIEALSAADYGAIDAMTTDQVAARWPYTDSVKHLVNPVITAPGKNHLGPSPDQISDNAVLTAPYALTLTATAGFQNSYFFADALENKKYTFSLKDNLTAHQQVVIDYLDAGGNRISGVFMLSGRSISFTTSAGIKQLRIIPTSEAAGTYTFNNWQLELGDAASPFEEASPKYMYVLTTLAGNPITGVYDTFDSQTKTVTRRFKTGVSLDGSLGWSYNSDGAGLKEIFLTNADFTTLNRTIAKYDGKIIADAGTDGDSLTVADMVRSISTVFVISISDAESGWAESLNPNDNSVAAIMNGWKANGNDGSVYNSWESILDGSAPETNTEAYVAANKAPGWTAWGTLDYQLAQTGEPEVVQVEGALSVPEGGAMVSLGEGVIDREVATPQLVGDQYYIGYAGGIQYSDNKILKIIKVFKNIDEDAAWIKESVTETDGVTVQERARIPETDHDDAAQYTFTYIVLDKYSMTSNAVDATIKYQTSDHSVMAQMVAKMADLETGLSIMQILYLRQQAEIDALEG